MSISSLLFVLDKSKSKKSHHLVLIEIANHINKHGLAWPSDNTIARKTGLSRRRVIGLVADLQAVGELEILPEGGPHSEQAYGIPGDAMVAPGMKSSGEIFDMEVVQPLHPNLVFEPDISGIESDDERDTPLTEEEALRLGLTKGPILFRKMTGQ
jgi:hypothetical protein